MSIKIKNKQNLEPWLNKDGSCKSDAEIKILGKSWSQATWHKYLDVSVGTLKDDRLVFFPFMDTETIKDGKELLDYFQERNYYPNLRFAFKLAINELSKDEITILKGYFFKGKSIAQLANELNRTSENVRKIKNRALRKIKESLLSARFRKKLRLLKKLQQAEEYFNKTGVI